MLFLNIAPYSNAGYAPLNPSRPGRLLLQSRDIDKLATQSAQKRLTVVSGKMNFYNLCVKVEIILVHGKKLHDHRKTLIKLAKERDME